MKATEKHFHVVLFIILIKVVQFGSIFESVDEILRCEHSIESFRAVLFFRPVMIDVHCSLTETIQLIKLIV